MTIFALPTTEANPEGSPTPRDNKNAEIQNSFNNNNIKEEIVSNNSIQGFTNNQLQGEIAIPGDANKQIQAEVDVADNQLADLKRFQIEDWGLIDYQTAWEKQRLIQAKVIDSPNQPYIIYCEHPSVYTAGRRTQPEDRPTNSIPVIDVDRGGKITWHGEGQLVIYPIISLKKRNDVVGYVRVLETAIIQALTEFNLQAERYCERSGVWFRDPNNPSNDRKIAAIGIRVVRGVTMHGVGININTDLSGFNLINPCGFTDSTVTSLSKELGQEVTIGKFKPILEKYLIPALSEIAN